MFVNGTSLWKPNRDDILYNKDVTRKWLLRCEV